MNQEDILARSVYLDTLLKMNHFHLIRMNKRIQNAMVDYGRLMTKLKELNNHKAFLKREKIELQTDLDNLKDQFTQEYYNKYISLVKDVANDKD